MRKIAILVACLASVTNGTAYARDAAVEAPIMKFVDTFNKGDIAGALSTMADTVAITDELAPFHWEGADAFKHWGADFEIDAKAKGITDPSVTIATPTRVLVAGGSAYVIVPATYRFKQNGAAMTEVAQMTFSLTKSTTGWKISGWTWTGPDATPAK